MRFGFQPRFAYEVRRKKRKQRETLHRWLRMQTKERNRGGIKVKWERGDFRIRHAIATDLAYYLQRCKVFARQKDRAKNWVDQKFNGSKRNEKNSFWIVWFCVHIRYKCILNVWVVVTGASRSFSSSLHSNRFPSVFVECTFFIYLHTNVHAR